MRTRRIGVIILGILTSFPCLAVDWTMMVSPADQGTYRDVFVDDFNKDGIMDVIGAKGHSEVTSVGDGLPVWFGSVYRSSNRWYWALSTPGDPKGVSASKPQANPTNVSPGIMHRVMIGNPFIDVEDWTATVDRVTKIAEVMYGNNIGNGTLDPEGPCVDIKELLVNDNEIWRCDYFINQGYWKVSSPQTGEQLAVLYTNMPYTSDRGEVSFCIVEGTVPFGDRDRISFRIETARFHAESSSGKVLSSSSSEYQPPALGVYFQDWRPIMGFQIDPKGLTNFELGDSFSFRVPHGPVTSDRFNKIAKADVDLDGYEDIVAAGVNGVKVFGQLGPSASETTFIPKPTRDRPLGSGDLIVGGLDQTTTLTEMWYVTANRSPDGIVTWSVSGEISGQMQQMSSGTGLYGSDHGEISFALSGSNFNTGDQFRFSTFRTTWSDNIGPTSAGEYISVAAKDITNDAQPDIIAGKAGGGIDVWINNQLTWTLASPPTTSGFYKELEVVDINYDGKMDLIGCSDGSGIRTWMGNGLGGWTAGTIPQATGSYEGMKVTDINNDGNLDIVATSMERGIHVWYQKEDGSWFQKSWASMPEPGVLNTGTGSMSSVNTDNEATITEGWRVECVATEVDGGTFTVTGDLSGLQTNPAYVGEMYTSDGQQVQFEILDGPTDFVVGDYFTFITGRGPLSNHRFHDVDIGDLDNDAKIDIFATSADQNGVIVWTGNAVFGWKLETSPINNSEYLAVAARRDMNFDGNPDVVAANASSGGIQVWIGNGQDKFSFSNWITKPIAVGQFYGVKIAELNNDHKPDVIAANFETGKDGVWVFYGNGGGDFQIGPAPTTVSKFYSVTAGDFNHDGFNDIAAGHSSQGVYVWLSNGDGTWNANSGPVASGSYWKVEVGDVNLDGNLDIAGAKDFDGIGGSVQIWLGNGDGTFIDGQYPINATYSLWNVGLADLNRDGILDIVVSGYTGSGGQWWYIDCEPGSMTLQFPSGGIIFSATGHDNFYGVLTKDFNADVIPDLILSEGGSGLYNFFNSGCTNCIATWYSTGSMDSGFKQNLASDDINNDGVPDFAVANLGAGISVWKTNFNGPSAVSTFQSIASPTSSGDYIGIDIKDVSNDGLADMVAGHAGSGGTGLDLWLSYRDFSLVQVTSTDPANNAEYNVGSDAPFRINFNKELDESTVTVSTVQVFQDNAPLYGSIFLSSNRKQVQYYPDKTIRANTQIRVVVKSGYDGILDIFGNPMDGNKNGIAEPAPVDDYTFEFTTADRTRPGMPQDVIAVPEDHCVLLRWRANAEADLKGYWVCWGTETRFNTGDIYPTELYYSKESFSAQPQFRICGLENGTIYYFGIVAEDLAGNYSPYSYEITATPAQLAPDILLGGYWGTSIDSGNGGMLRFLVLVSDPQADVAGVEFLYAGVPTGLYLSDDGAHNDFAAYDGVYGFTTQIPSGVPAGNYQLDVRAVDQLGHFGLVWPYYSVLESGPVLTNSADYQWTPPEPELESWTSTTIGAPAPGSPEIAVAGYMGSVGSPEAGGTLNLIAYVVDPDGYEDIAAVEVYFGGVATGVFLADDGAQGDFGSGDGIFGITLQIPPASGLAAPGYRLELVASDQEGNRSAVWPDLNVY